MTEFSWPERAKAAVSLTFDDARPTQIDVGIPILDEFGVKGTFFISPDAADLRLADWKSAAASGHEIGNHTMTHPCSGSFEFVRIRGNALEDFDLERMASEIDDASAWIKDRFGITPTSFAYPCGQTFVGKGSRNQSYVPLVAGRFLAGRMFASEIAIDPRWVDLAQTWSFAIDRMEPAQALHLLEDGFRSGHWMVLTGHEIAPGHPQGILPVTLAAICDWTRKKKSAVWIDTISRVASHIRSFGSASPGCSPSRSR